MSAFGILIDSDMFQNVFESDFKEASELLNFNIILLVAFVLCFCAFMLKLKITDSNFKLRILSVFGAFVLLLACFLPFSKHYIPFFRNYNEVRMYNAPFYQFYALYRYYVKSKKNGPLQGIAQDATLKDSTKKLMIFVLGETARAKNYSLGDYKTNDTNFYTKNEGVVYFSNFSSCGTSTAVSLPCMFSKDKRSDFNGNDFKENALDVLQRVGVSVAYFSNNYGGCKGICDRILTKQFLHAEFDEALLNPLQESLKSLGNTNLIVLHLQGSHGPAYFKRYPNSFKKFMPTCDTNTLSHCSKNELINTYDNTLLYTDYILGNIIESLKNLKGYKSALLYVSDHGESLGEGGIYLHGMPYALAPKEQTHVPLIFWSNDEYFMQKAREHKDLALSHDNLFSTMLGFFGVASVDYVKNDNFLDDNLEHL